MTPPAFGDFPCLFRFRRTAGLDSLGALLLLALTLGSLSPASGQDEEPALREQRWQEQAFGFSLRPPAESRQQDFPNEDSLVRFTAGHDYALQVSIRRSREPMTLQMVKEQALQQFAFAWPSSVVLEDRRMEMAGREGLVLYYHVRNLPTLARITKVEGQAGGQFHYRNAGREGEAWIFGQAIMPIDPYHVVLVEFESQFDVFEERSRAVFDAVVASFELMDPEELDRQRHAWFDAGDRWLRGITPQHVHVSLIPDRWYRVMQGEQDVGYVHIREQRDEELGLPGVRLTIQTTEHGAEHRLDTLSDIFLSDDGATEVWSARTTQRPLGRRFGRGDQSPAMSAHDATRVETGLRTGPRLSVTREGPAEMAELDWQQPPRGYLSQAQLHLLPRLLPQGEAMKMAFYAYDSYNTDVTLRTWRIEPMTGGGFILHEQPAPNRPERVAVYDRQGQLLEHRLADGRRMVVATPEQIRRIWDRR